MTSPIAFTARDGNGRLHKGQLRLREGGQQQLQRWGWRG